MPLLNQSTAGESSPDQAALLRCPACERTLAFDPSLAGQTIICPTCQRRLRMPIAGEPVADLGGAAAFEQPGTWRPPGRTTTTAVPSPYEKNPYAPTPTVAGDAVGLPDQRTNYTLPGIFLVALSGPGLLLVGLYLMGLMVGLAAGQAVVAGPVELFMLLVFFTLAGISHGASFVGGMQMIRRRRLGLARLGAWAALYPCGICGFLQMPFAVWALVLLHRNSAPADFASSADPAPRRLP